MVAGSNPAGGTSNYLFDRRFEAVARSELDECHRRDGDGGSGARIDTFAGGPIAGIKGAKAGNTDAFARCHCALDYTEKRIEGALTLAFGQVRFGGE